MKVTLYAASIALLALSQTAAAETQAEKEARRACEAKICDIVASRDPSGEDVACDIVTTWPEEELVEAMGGRINWPWGGAMCQSKVTLERAAIVKAMSEASYEMTLPAQTARCALAQKEGGEPYVIEISVAPRLKFENGKAVEGQVNWGKASAPMTIYPLIYAGTALDNSTNALGPELVRVVNEFTTKKCTQVKATLPSPKLHETSPPCCGLMTVLLNHRHIAGLISVGVESGRIDAARTNACKRRRRK
jgi:hypothetical protein